MKLYEDLLESVSGADGEQVYSLSSAEQVMAYQHLRDAGELTVRVAYNLFSQAPGQELTDYERWVTMTEPGCSSRITQEIKAIRSLRLSGFISTWVKRKPGRVPSIC
mgnify:CR=1 FL=1